MRSGRSQKSALTERRAVPLIRPKHIERKTGGIERWLRHGGGVFQNGQQQPLAGALLEDFQGAQIGWISV
jgi:hypothetical protein